MSANSSFRIMAGKELLECNYDFSTRTYSFSFDCTGVDCADMSSAWFYKIRMLFPNYKIKIGSCEILGFPCEVYLSYGFFSENFTLNIVWQTLFKCYFVQNLVEYIGSCNFCPTIAGGEALSINLGKSDIIRAFVDNNDFCLKFCEVLIKTANDEFEKEMGVYELLHT